MSMNETILEKKPYDFVPLLDKCARNTMTNQNTIQRGMYSGKLNLSIKTLAPIHISQGVLGFNSDKTELGDLMIRRAGKIVIPGSSLKGLIRSIAEAVSYSCAPKSPAPRIQKLNDAYPGGNRGRCRDQELCITCSMFGTVEAGFSYKSKLSFGEFKLPENSTEFLRIPDLQSPFKDYPTVNKLFLGGSKGYGNERLYYCAACSGRAEGRCKTCSKQNYYSVVGTSLKRNIRFRGRKFYFHNTDTQQPGQEGKSQMYEVVKKGSVFKGSIYFENLSEGELQLMAFSLGLDNSFSPKIGYAKPAFYGSVQITLDSVSDMKARYGKKDNALTKEKVLELAKSYYDKSPKDIRDNIDKLRDILDISKKHEEWPDINGNKIY